MPDTESDRCCEKYVSYSRDYVPPIIQSLARNGGGSGTESGISDLSSSRSLATEEGLVPSLVYQTRYHTRPNENDSRDSLGSLLLSERKVAETNVFKVLIRIR